ncbi:uncharacterized protein LOC127011626 [Drosophila biarmipes]|uniref:uncharacterized protein LOC127011626 n=1 Tax=Drosophila biarmipes TaxID=125945 RepID=UPI0021CD1731|nr:uncharacterized protein LOC127011626 [Drosophila biarmipes]
MASFPYEKKVDVCTVVDPKKTVYQHAFFKIVKILQNHEYHEEGKKRNLPADHLRALRPFAKCGDDFCGPVYTTLRIRGSLGAEDGPKSCIATTGRTSSELVSTSKPFMSGPKRKPTPYANSHQKAYVSLHSQVTHMGGL